MDAIYEWYQEKFGVSYVDVIFSRPSVHYPPWIAAITYMLILLFLGKIVKLINPKGLYNKWVFFSWNIFLSVLSFFMHVFIAVPYFKLSFERGNGNIGLGLWKAICIKGRDSTFDGSSPNTIFFWLYMFAISKYFELFDTVLLICKRPDSFPPLLHWYHHLTVLLFTWYAVLYRMSAGYLFVIMNSLIHTFMYYYYAMAAIGRKPKWAFALTMGQISQMVFGTIFNGVWTYGYLYRDDCKCFFETGCKIIFISCGIMYFSYFLLFVRFAYYRYFAKKSKAN